MSSLTLVRAPSLASRGVMFRLRTQFARAIHLGRIVPELDHELADKVAQDQVNVKRIRTRRHIGFTGLPALLEVAATKRINDVADRHFREEARQLVNIMFNIKMPDDHLTLSAKKADIKTVLQIRDKIRNPAHYSPSDDRLSEEQFMAQDELRAKVSGYLEKTRRDWHYYDYDEYASALYMAVRLAPNYAALKTVMNEIRDQDPDFKPTSVLDFGSGMGTTIWAVEETWQNAVREFLNIEISKEQQTLCEYLIRGASHFGENLQNIYHRQYLPTSERNKYDMVVAAFSLLELPNSHMRSQTIENLWRKTNDLLVFVERGTIAGFTAINEARHFVLDLAGHRVTSRLGFTAQTKPRANQLLPEAHVLAPCSHEYACPRLTMSTKQNRNICKFRVHFEPLELGTKKSGFLREDFSYVVLRKRPHTSYTAENEAYSIRWPRIVAPRSKSGGLVTQRLCCPDGCLAEATFTRKNYGNPAWKVAKVCNWGDILPIRVSDKYLKRSESELRLLKSATSDDHKTQPNKKLPNT